MNKIFSIVWLIENIGFNDVSAIFRSYNGGGIIFKSQINKPYHKPLNFEQTWQKAYFGQEVQFYSIEGPRPILLGITMKHWKYVYHL